MFPTNSKAIGWRFGMIQLDSSTCRVHEFTCRLKVWMQNGPAYETARRDSLLAKQQAKYLSRIHVLHSYQWTHKIHHQDSCQDSCQNMSKASISWGIHDIDPQLWPVETSSAPSHVRLHSEGPIQTSKGARPAGIASPRRWFPSWALSADKVLGFRGSYCLKMSLWGLLGTYIWLVFWLVGTCGDLTCSSLSPK